MVEHRCFDPKDKLLHAVRGEAVPDWIVEQMPAVGVRLEERGLAEPEHGRRALELRLDADGAFVAGTVYFGETGYDVTAASLAVEEWEAPGSPPSEDAPFHARVTFRLHVLFDTCQDQAPVDDLVTEGWPGPCGYVPGEPRPQWPVHAEFLVRRERYVATGQDPVELFEARCVPLTGLGHVCRLIGRGNSGPLWSPAQGPG